MVIRAAATTLDISYTAARNAVAELKPRLGVATVPVMIGIMLELAADEFVADARAYRQDLFSLGEQQFAIARGFSITKSRREAPKTLCPDDKVMSGIVVSSFELDD